MCSRHRPLNGADSYDIDLASADGAQESLPRSMQPDHFGHDPNTGPGSDYCVGCGQYAQPLQKFAVLMDVNKWDPDHGRAWITVTAVDSLDAMDQVRSMYPKAAVLRAETAA